MASNSAWQLTFTVYDKRGANSRTTFWNTVLLSLEIFSKFWSTALSPARFLDPTNVSLVLADLVDFLDLTDLVDLVDLIYIMNQEIKLSISLISEPDFTVTKIKENLVNLSTHCTVHLELSAARDTNIVEHKIVCLPILSLYIIHSHQQPESRFFVKPMWLAPYSPNCSLD